MRNKILIVLALLLSSNTVLAERWVAKCTDGKAIHYVQKYKGAGYLFMEVKSPFGERKMFPMATLQQSTSNSVSICGVVLGNKDPQQKPIAQICMNRDRQIIYMKFDHPQNNKGLQEGEFCKASVNVFIDS